MAHRTRIPNAEKWNEEIVIYHVKEIKHHAAQADVACLRVALIKQGLYRELWAYWKKKFYHHDDILEQMMLVESIFEARTEEDMIRKRIPFNVAQFILKNCYGWGKPEVEDEDKNRFYITMINEDLIDVVDREDRTNPYDRFMRIRDEGLLKLAYGDDGKFDISKFRQPFT